jgi:hypothetical protein
MVIEIPKDLKPISSNDFYSGVHWTKRKKIADEWHLKIKLICRELRIEPVKKCKLIFDFNNRFDIDNNSAMIKMVIDGMVIAGIFPDDNKDHIKEIVIRESKYNRLTILEMK